MRREYANGGGVKQMYLIVGAGFLGTYLARYLSVHTDAPIMATVRDLSDTLSLPRVRWVSLDVTDPGSINRLAGICSGEPLTVFYFAACHNVDYLYLHPQEGRRINCEGLAGFLNTVPGIQRLFFASTDCVYGENPPQLPKMKETDPCNPVNEYGRQKLDSEKIVLAHGFTVIRLPYMLGPSLLKKRHFYDAIFEKLSLGTPVDMIDGMVRSALSYETAAQLLAMLALQTEKALPGIYNLCSDGEYSKYDLGLRIAARAGVPASLVHRITEFEAASFFKDRRASRSVMDNTKLKTLLGIGEIPLEV